MGLSPFLASKSGVKRGGGAPLARGQDQTGQCGRAGRDTGARRPGLRRFRILGMVEILCPIPSIPRPSNTDK